LLFLAAVLSGHTLGHHKTAWIAQNPRAHVLAINAALQLWIRAIIRKSLVPAQQPLAHLIPSDGTDSPLEEALSRLSSLPKTHILTTGILFLTTPSWNHAYLKASSLHDLDCRPIVETRFPICLKQVCAEPISYSPKSWKDDYPYLKMVSCRLLVWKYNWETTHIPGLHCFLSRDL
jgi:hypothetical protein